MAERKHYTKAELQARKTKAAPTFRYGWADASEGIRPAATPLLEQCRDVGLHSPQVE
jgi:hypothetical protein